MTCKLLAVSLMVIFSIGACKKRPCISCIAQNKKTGIIIDTRAECDKSTEYLDGYIAGFKERYKAQADSIVVICN